MTTSIMLIERNQVADLHGPTLRAGHNLVQKQGIPARFLDKRELHRLKPSDLYFKFSFNDPCIGA